MVARNHTLLIFFLLTFTYEFEIIHGNMAILFML